MLIKNLISLNNDFVHLRVYSEYSISQGIISLDELIKEAKKDNQQALAITDLNNIFSSIKFYKICLENKLKPIIGCDIYISNKKNNNNPHRLLLLIKNKLGYLNLSKLISRASLYNKNKDTYEFKKIWFNSSLSKGLIALSGANLGDIGYYLSQNKIKSAEKCAKFWIKCFPNRFYIEIQRHDEINLEVYNNRAIKLSNNLKLPLVATHPILFLNKSDFLAHEIRNCISTNTIFNDFKKNFSENQFFYSKKKMIKLFRDIPSAIINTIEISKKCNLILDLEKIKLPFFKLKKSNNNKYLIKLSIKGLKKKLKQTYVNFKKKFLLYKKRLLYECKIIIYMGYSDYFLIVNDFIKWAKNKNIPIGPGRGSSAGSLVAYSLDITDLDPIKYNLLFERFLNPERISMPDFDIDFCQDKRERVINYVKKKYGINSVCNIITFGTMAAKAAIRDVGRVLSFNYNFIDKIARLIPFKFNESTTISILKKKNYILDQRYKKEPEVKKIIDLASKMEGKIRNLGVHSGGLIISPNKVFDFCPICTQNNIITTHFHKDNNELIGMLKFDFLGLTTLTILSNCLKTIKKKYKINSKKFLKKISLYDESCFYNLKKANTIGVFQLESIGMRAMLKKAKPNCFENIIALVSLYRPGPIELLPNFCLRKLGKEKINYIHISLKSILEETYGIIIYQEQVMQIAQKIANYSLGKADILRRAMSKKDQIEMSNQRNTFCFGAVSNGLTKNKANEIFNLMEKFSSYGFNKSHAAAYSLISYYTIWLKTHYITEFMSSSMTYSSNDINKLDILIRDSIKNYIYILPININVSEYNFISFNKKTKKIRYGFSGIKGLGKNIIDEILKLRKEELFNSLFDFYRRINKYTVNYRTIEILICSGAFDCIDCNRANLINNLNIIVKLFSKTPIINQKFLFNKFNIYDINKKKNFFWNFKIKIIEEKLVMGFFLINNLYNIYKNKFKYIKTYNFKKNKEVFNKLIWGIVYDIKERSILNKKLFIFTINNNFNEFEVIIDNYLLVSNTKKIKKYNFLSIIVDYKKNKFNNNLQFIGKKLINLNEFMKIFKKLLW